MKKPLLLAISGSLRFQSYTTAILATIAERATDLADIRLHPLRDLPLYNQDEDTSDAPEGVRGLRSAIGAADGLLIASPEYNHGVSGVLKNALDWASRPYGQSTLTGKPVLTLTSSPASTGGVRAQAQLNETLASIAARVVLRPQIVISGAHDKIRQSRLQDEATIAFILEGVRDLIEVIGVGIKVREED